jgi:hypothetical protein
VDLRPSYDRCDCELDVPLPSRYYLWVHSCVARVYSQFSRKYGKIEVAKIQEDYLNATKEGGDEDNVTGPERKRKRSEEMGEEDSPPAAKKARITGSNQWQPEAYKPVKPNLHLVSDDPRAMTYITFRLKAEVAREYREEY